MLTTKQVALLSICGGISGKIEQCGGNPTTTTGAFGDAIFSLKAVSGTIDITKGRWEGCVAAARSVMMFYKFRDDANTDHTHRATCGNSPFTSTCIGGADVNAQNVEFSLSQASGCAA
jgi:hypothetical protein